MKIVNITIKLKYEDSAVATYADTEIERMLESNFDVAQGIFDLGVDSSPVSVRVDIEAE